MRRTLSLATMVLCAVGADATGFAARDEANGGTTGEGATVRLAVEAVAIPASAGAIRVDGLIAEEIWMTAAPVTEFVQRDPDEGAPATHLTEARVAYDHSAVYVAVHAIDQGRDRIVGHLTRRDEASPSDWVRVLIDSYRDRRTAYEFAVNAAGVKQDRYWFNDTQCDPGWDAVWEAAVVRTDEGWRAEFRIPFSQLRFNAASAGTFGFALVREIPHANETATWPLLAKSAPGFVSSFGELRGLALPRTGRRLELQPYSLAKVTTTPDAASNPLASSPASDVAAGLDLKYQVAPGLTLTGTVNPDFGQVEADPAVVNLGAFETFLPERRPFFVEGSGNYAFDVDCNDGQCTGLFYSRRIGRAPQRTAEAGEDGYAMQPANTTILGAVKLNGRIGRFAIGALNAVTGREDARLASPAEPGPLRSPVEPLTSYSIVRATREFDNSSRFGVILTHTARRLPDELDFLPASATTGGVDGDWRLRDGSYSLNGYLAGSLVRGSEAAISRLQRNTVHGFQRPDAGHVDFDPSRTALGGLAGAIRLGKISGERTRFSSGIKFKSPGFDINDLGFQMRADEIMQGHWFQVRDDQPGRFVRNFSINFNQWAAWNFDGDLRMAGGNINAHWVLNSNWAFGAGVNANVRGFDDRLTRGGPGGYRPAGLSVWAYLNTDDRRAVAAETFVNVFRDRQGSSSWAVEPTVTVRPLSALAVSLGLHVSHNLRDTQWVSNVEAGEDTQHVFGRLDQTTVAASTRVSYTLGPTLTLQLYAQPFVSAGAYTDFRQLTDGRADAYADRYGPVGYDGRPDFTVLSFRTTNVLRWEYRPGSALFVVWQQAREDSLDHGTFDLARGLGGTLDAPATNVFLVKLSRWFNF